MDDDHELARLKAIGAWMREDGITELSLGDLHVKRPLVIERAHPRASIDPDEATELAAEEATASELSAEERAWNKKWRRITRSSGAPIPPFPTKPVQ